MSSKMFQGNMFAIRRYKKPEPDISHFLYLDHPEKGEKCPIQLTNAKAGVLPILFVTEKQQCPACKAKSCIHNKFVEGSIAIIENGELITFFFLCMCESKGDFFLVEGTPRKVPIGLAVCQRCNCPKRNKLGSFKLSLKVEKNKISDVYRHNFGNHREKILTLSRCVQCMAYQEMIQANDDRGEPFIRMYYYGIGELIDDIYPIQAFVHELYYTIERIK